MGLSSLRRCTRPGRARVPPTAVSLREYENSTTYPRTLHIAAPAPSPRGHSMRSRDSSRPNTARKDEEGPCSQPTDSQRTHRGLAPQQRQSAGAAAATLRARPRPQRRGVCARVQNGGVLTSLGSSRAAFWRRHRICARSRTLLVRASADAARALPQRLNSLISGWMPRRGGSFDPFKRCQASISIPQPEIIIDLTQLTEQLVSGILTLEAHFSIKYDNFFNDLGPYRDETLIREQLANSAARRRRMSMSGVVGSKLHRKRIESGERDLRCLRQLVMWRRNTWPTPVHQAREAHRTSRQFARALLASDLLKLSLTSKVCAIVTPAVTSTHLSWVVGGRWLPRYLEQKGRRISRPAATTPRPHIPGTAPPRLNAPKPSPEMRFHPTALALYRRGFVARASSNPKLGDQCDPARWVRKGIEGQERFFMRWEEGGVAGLLEGDEVVDAEAALPLQDAGATRADARTLFPAPISDFAYMTHSSPPGKSAVEIPSASRTRPPSSQAPRGVRPRQMRINPPHNPPRTDVAAQDAPRSRLPLATSTASRIPVALKNATALLGAHDTDSLRASSHCTRCSTRVQPRVQWQREQRGGGDLTARSRSRTLVYTDRGQRRCLRRPTWAWRGRDPPQVAHPRCDAPTSSRCNWRSRTHVQQRCQARDGVDGLHARSRIALPPRSDRPPTRNSSPVVQRAMALGELLEFAVARRLPPCGSSPSGVDTIRSRRRRGYEGSGGVSGRPARTYVAGVKTPAGAVLLYAEFSLEVGGGRCARYVEGEDAGGTDATEQIEAIVDGCMRLLVPGRQLVDGDARAAVGTALVLLPEVALRARGGLSSWFWFYGLRRVLQATTGSLWSTTQHYAVTLTLRSDARDHYTALHSKGSTTRHYAVLRRGYPPLRHYSTAQHCRSATQRCPATPGFADVLYRPELDRSGIAQAPGQMLTS
ncbi:hypothetical protein DFH09DRAFT_1102070 [Mycena vulgaris]|nr:hypothetical protein DFH09DRAFT_1102070 [Mycena vulgaris]